MDNFILLNIFKYVEPFVFQILKLVSTDFNLLINSEEHLWLDYLETLFDCQPFEWMNKIPFNQRTHLIKWIINDLNLLKKLEPIQLIHYPTEKFIMDKIDELILIKKSDYQYENLYSRSLSDKKLKDISDHCYQHIKRQRDYDIYYVRAWNLRYDLLDTSTQMSDFVEDQILEELAKRGTPSDFETWFNYFDKTSKNDFTKFALSKNFQQENYMYKDNIHFIVFLRRLGKMHVIDFNKLMVNDSFDVLHYLIDSYSDITKSGISYPIIDLVIHALSYYKGKRGLQLFQWVRPILDSRSFGFNVISIKNSVITNSVITFRNFELLQELIAILPQINYSNFTYHVFIRSQKVLNFCEQNLQFKMGHNNFSDVQSVGALIHLLKNGLKFSFINFYRGMPIKNCKNLLKSSPEKLKTYFSLLFFGPNESLENLKFAKEVSYRYLMTLLEHHTDCGTKENDFLKICQSIPNFGNVMDHNLSSQLKEKRFYHVITWIHKNNYFDYNKDRSSLFMAFNFNQWRQRFIPNYKKSKRQSSDLFLDELLNELMESETK